MKKTLMKEICEDKQELSDVIEEGTTNGAQTAYSRSEEDEARAADKGYGITVIIPAYEPPHEFIDYARRVTEFADRLVVVNDGSSPEFDGVFSQIAAMDNVEYITYEENHGKGYALKQALAYCTSVLDDNEILVTADCDGQHSIKDIERVASSAAAHRDALVLGSRDFTQENVPKRSRAGNSQMRRIFHLLYGLDVYDTQTGLRGFTVKLAREYAGVKGDRFEYEMGVLIHSQKNDIPVIETPIETIYPDDPKDHVSHFKTFRDSARMMGMVLKNLNWYLISSAISAVVDVLIFYLLSAVVLGNVSAINTLIATVVARVSSSVINFYFNYKYVFAGKSRTSLFRYYTLWLCQLGASYGLVFLLGNIAGLDDAGIELTVMKAIGDLILAMLSYQVQRLWVFAKRDKKRFYGPLVRISQQLYRAFTKRYRCNVLPVEEGAVYVCRHLDMHGPMTTLKCFRFNVHPMVFSPFFDKRDCYRQYADYTFTARRGKKKKRFNLKAYLASRFVPLYAKSIKAIPVYRGSIDVMKTFRTSLGYLQAGESVIVYPDIEYTASADRQSDIYDGFLLLGQMYKRVTGKSLKFVPVYIDEKRRRINEMPYVTVDNFKEDKDAAVEYITAAINGVNLALDEKYSAENA